MLGRLISRGRAPQAADDVGTQLAALGSRIEEIAATLDSVAAEQHELTRGQTELRARLRRTQALGARTYEALHDWPALLAEARSAPDYNVAFTEPTPLVSIPIPTYHSPATLCDRALASVIEQTHSNWEAIVVGDHCTDDTEERVRAIGDPRIRYVNLAVRERDPNDPWETWAIRGSVPRATGIAMAVGRWIAPLSHDDAWDPDHLATLLDAARSARAEVAYSRMRVVAANDPALPVVGSIGAYPPELGQWGWQSALFHGALSFLRYDRNCAFASEPNDWNLARRAWEAGVRFHPVPRETVALFSYDRRRDIDAAYEKMGVPTTAAADTL